jgi:PRTRC genetic system protein E
MSRFESIYPLAQKTTLTLLITAEGDQLRVNVTPRANDDAKGEKPLYPLSILATPAELDRDFAEAVAIYEPSTLSVLDQARAASAANSGDKPSTPALPAPGTARKGNTGKKGRTSASTPETDTPAAAGDAPSAPEVDPRQTQIPGIDDAPGAAQTTPAAAEETGAPAAPADAATEPETPAEDAGAVDIF